MFKNKLFVGNKNKMIFTTDQSKMFGNAQNLGLCQVSIAAYHKSNVVATVNKKYDGRPRAVNKPFI